MTSPISLTEEIIALGFDWAKRCRAAIPNAPNACLMQLEDATVISPSSGDSLPGRLYLTKQAIPVVAIVLPPHAKYWKSDPDYSEDRYAIVEDAKGESFKGPFRNILWVAPLLHELTHVVDSLFLN
jgi:hypothetical protein